MNADAAIDRLGVIAIFVELCNSTNMQLETAAESFAALSQPTRLETLRRLVAAGGGGLPAGALASEAGVSAPNMSFHLKELQRAGLIAASRDGREIHYRADFGGIRALVEFLMADCCNGDPRLCGPYVLAAPKHAAKA